jgi:hypothetical protein
MSPSLVVRGDLAVPLGMGPESSLSQHSGLDLFLGSATGNRGSRERSGADRTISTPDHLLPPPWDEQRPARGWWFAPIGRPAVPVIEAAVLSTSRHSQDAGDVLVGSWP